MSKRRSFNELLASFSTLKEKGKLYSKENPRLVIAAMFLILLLSVTGLLISRILFRKGYSDSVDKIYSKMEGAAEKPKLKERPNTGNMLELYDLQRKMRTVDPDSLTLDDSLILKEISKDLDAYDLNKDQR